METKHKVILLALFGGIPLVLFLSVSLQKPASLKPASAVDTASVPPAAQDPSDATPTPPMMPSPSPTQPPQQSTNVPMYSPPILSSTPAPTPTPPLEAPSMAPLVFTNGPGLLTGDYYYVVTFVSTSGVETDASPTSIFASPHSQQLWVSSIPTASDGPISERKLYRTLGNGSMAGPYYLVTSFNNNSTTFYYDNIPDSVLSAELPKFF